MRSRWLNGPRSSRLNQCLTRVWVSAIVALLAVVTVGTARHYLSRHRFLFGDKYDSVMIDQKDLDAMAHLATLPGARNTVIGDSNVDGTAWMYAVADLHPLWTHYDFPQQIGPGYYRYIFWAYADADALPAVPDETRALVPEAIRALNIRYVLTSAPDGREVQGARRTSVDRPVEVVDEDLRQRWSLDLRMGGSAAHPDNSRR